MVYQEKNILIVDDDRGVAEILGMYLQEFGYKTTLAHSTSQAREIASQEKSIDLVLMDIELPDGNGADLGEYLATEHDCQNIIYMSGNPYSPHTRKVISQGYCFLQKPFNLQDLSYKVQERI